MMSDYANAEKCFQETLEISRTLDEQYGNVDTFGEMADMYADMGNFEKAGEVCGSGVPLFVFQYGVALCGMGGVMDA